MIFKYFFIIISTIINLYTQDLVLSWKKIYDSGKHDNPIEIVTDKYGNIYIAGQTGLPNNYDLLVIKYDSSGNLKWVKTYDSGSHDLGYAIALSENGNLYVAGQISNSSSGWDYMLLKYDTSGNFYWCSNYNWSPLDGAYAVEVDNNENIYLFGQSSNISSHKADYILLKLDSNGNKIWESTYRKGITFADSYGLALDKFSSNSFIYVSGYTTNDFLVIKYSTNGNRLWAKRFDESILDFGMGITIDREHNFYLTGSSYNTAFSQYNLVLIKGDSNGNLIWKKRLDSTKGEMGFDLVERDGYIYVSGSANNGLNDDFLFLKFDTLGNLLWRIIYDTGSQNKGYGIAMDNTGNIYITGYTLNLNYDALTLKYQKFSEQSESSFKKSPVKPPQLHFGIGKGIIKKIKELKGKIEQEE